MTSPGPDRRLATHEWVDGKFVPLSADVTLADVVGLAAALADRPTSAVLDSRLATTVTGLEQTVSTSVGAAVADLVDSAPSTLDTLSELAAALGNDPNFATSITTLIGTKEPAAWTGTQAEYDQLVSRDPARTYYVTG